MRLLPAFLGIRAERIALSMKAICRCPSGMQVRQGKLGGEAMIEDDIGNVWVSGDCPATANIGTEKLCSSAVSMAMSASSATASSIRPYSSTKFFAVPVVRGEVEVSRLHQMIANTNSSPACVAITEFGNREFRWLACAGLRRDRASKLGR